MTLSYLYKADSVQLKADGTGIIKFRPDVGQYWWPTLIHVGLRTQQFAILNPGTFPVNANTDNVVCEVRAGSVAALDTDTSTTKDKTAQGVNDTTSILSGTVITYGEGIACVFSAGNLFNDIAYAEIHGLSSDKPVPEGILPGIPAARFNGAATAADVVSNILGPTNIAAGATFISNSLDMRNFNSYNLRMDFAVPGVPTANGQVLITLNWTNVVFPSGLLYAENYKVFPDAGIPFTSTIGRFMINDACHGPLLSYNVKNNGPDLITITHQLAGNAVRPMGRSYVQNDNIAINPAQHFIDGIMPPFNNFVGVGASTDLIWPMAPGNGIMSVITAGTTYSITIFDPTNTVIWSANIPANASLNFPMAWPRTAMRVHITNTGAAAVGINISATSYSDVY